MVKLPGKPGPSIFLPKQPKRTPRTPPACSGGIPLHSVKIALQTTKFQGPLWSASGAGFKGHQWKATHLGVLFCLETNPYKEKDLASRTFSDP